MHVKKKVIANLEKCYSLAELSYRGRHCFLVAAEKHDPCLRFDEDGTLHMVFNDYDLPYACPMIEEEIELDGRFVQATYTVWKHLIRDPLIYDMVWGESRDRDMDSYE